MKDFNLSEIPSEAWHTRALSEANKIKTNKSFIFSGRTFENLLWRTKQGHACEQYLMLYCSHTDDEREFQDVLDPDKNPTAVKACNPNWLDQNLEDWAKDKIANPWKEWPDILHVWGNISKVEGIINPEYTYISKYVWSENKWKKRLHLT